MTDIGGQTGWTWNTEWVIGNSCYSWGLESTRKKLGYRSPEAQGGPWGEGAVLLVGHLSGGMMTLSLGQTAAAAWGHTTGKEEAGPSSLLQPCRLYLAPPTGMVRTGQQTRNECSEAQPQHQESGWSGVELWNQNVTETLIWESFYVPNESYPWDNGSVS